MDLKLANIELAARTINPVFLNSPQFADDQLSAGLGQRTIVKVETANPIRSFKGRGADFLLHTFDRKQRIVCASAGNFGQAVRYQQLAMQALNKSERTEQLSAMQDRLKLYYNHQAYQGE